jgi:AraC-like DNA-binding protein
VQVVRRKASARLSPYLLGGLEGWSKLSGETVLLREVPFPGVPLILNLGEPWEIGDPGVASERRDSFVAGMHTAPSIVRASATWTCIELRVTPLAARRILGLPMHELANRTVNLAELLPGIDELTTRLHESASWAERFDLVESFLAMRLDASEPAHQGVEWSWQRLRSAGGRVAIGDLANELGWSHRRLISRFREQIGLAPKAAARVLRFDSVVRALTSTDDGELARIALDCGYFDQAHLNRDFRELAGTTPTSFVRSRLDGAGVAA